MTSAPSSNKMLRLPAVEKIAGVSGRTIYRWETNGSFPRRRQIGPNTVGWLESEIMEWIAAREPVSHADAA